MARKARPAPSLAPAVLALLVLVGLGYLMFTDSQPSRTEHTLTPPIELVEPELEEVTIAPELPSFDNQPLVEEEAELFIDALAEDDGDVVLTEERGEFVRHDGSITLPIIEHRTTTIEGLLADRSLAADTPLTLHFTETEKHRTTLRELDSSTEDKQQILTIEQDDGTLVQAPLTTLLDATDPDTPITVVDQRQRSIELTAGELARTELSPSQEVIASINRGVENILVRDIVQSGEISDSTLFYLHRVTERDRQGLWGIIQSGLIERFRRGLRLEGIYSDRDMVRVTIPADADEPLPDGLSSYLGRVLHHKVESSYIYNFSTRTMGRNPDLIYPGQEVILIQFSPDELKQIYLFFAEQRRQQAESFPVAP